MESQLHDVQVKTPALNRPIPFIQKLMLDGMFYFLTGTAARRDSSEAGSGFKGASSGGREKRTDGETGGGGGKSQRAEQTDPDSHPTGFFYFIYDDDYVDDDYLTYYPTSLQLAELRKQSEEVNTAVEAGEETRRKLQRELDSALQRERQKEEEKDRIERQRERLREEIEDMTLALQRERQNCTALEKRQKKFDQVLKCSFKYYAHFVQISKHCFLYVT